MMRDLVHNAPSVHLLKMERRILENITVLVCSHDLRHTSTETLAKVTIITYKPVFNHYHSAMPDDKADLCLIFNHVYTVFKNTNIAFIDSIASYSLKRLRASLKIYLQPHSSSLLWSSLLYTRKRKACLSRETCANSDTVLLASFMNSTRVFKSCISFSSSSTSTSLAYVHIASFGYWICQTHAKR
jgi:hypothetical protein